MQSLFFKNVTGLRYATLLKKRLWYRCFPVNFAKFLRTSFAQNTSGQLLLCTTASETSNTKYLELKLKEDQKFKKRICQVNVLSILTNENHFPKTISQWELDYGLFTIYRDLPNLPNFLNEKEVSYLPWQNMYPNSETTCHVKLKFFLWT